MGGTKMSAVWTAIIGLGSSIFTGLFGMKKDQADVVRDAFKMVDGVTNSDAAYFSASQAAISSVYQHGGFLERGWRPALMWVCIGLVIGRWYGYLPPGLDATEIEHLYDFVYIGLGGYMPLRTVEKITKGLQLGSILKTFINKKIL